jgi:hypothetical protein
LFRRSAHREYYAIVQYRSIHAFQGCWPCKCPWPWRLLR